MAKAAYFSGKIETPSLRACHLTRVRLLSGHVRPVRLPASLRAPRAALFTALSPSVLALTPPRSATARRSPCSGPPASPPSPQPPPTNTPLPSVRCASRVGGPRSCALSTRLSPPRALSAVRQSPCDIRQAHKRRHRAPPLLSLHTRSPPRTRSTTHAFSAQGPSEPSASAPPTTSARR